MLSRSLVVAAAALLLASGCSHKERFGETTAIPVRSDPSIAIDIELRGNAVWKPDRGDLVVPLKVRNKRTGTIAVVPQRCEVELTNGTRCSCREPDEKLTIEQNGDLEETFVFGGKSNPVVGTSYRVYLWIEQATGKGAGKLIEYVPPLVINGSSSTFAYPPRPFRTDASTGKAPEDEFPPPAGPNKTVELPPGTQMVHCSKCGEPFPATDAFCPQCGTPREKK